MERSLGGGRVTPVVELAAARGPSAGPSRGRMAGKAERRVRLFCCAEWAVKPSRAGSVGIQTSSGYLDRLAAI